MDISGKDASLKIWMVPIYVSRLAFPKRILWITLATRCGDNFRKYSSTEIIVKNKFLRLLVPKLLVKSGMHANIQIKINFVNCTLMNVFKRNLLSIIHLTIFRNSKLRTIMLCNFLYFSFAAKTVNPTLFA